MPNLLYVTSDVLNVLRQHRAYQFWSPIYLNTPIKHLIPEDRVFHPRKIKIENGAIYLTTDMKFVYCRDKLFSFLYDNQDLAFRLTAENGILKSMDNKQFTALIGKIAEVVSSSEVGLVNENTVYHPFFDNVGFVSSGAVESSPAKPKKAVKKGAAKIDTTGKNEELILGKYEPKTCEQIVKFRTSSKKSYKYLSSKFEIPESDVKEICKIYALKKRFEAAGEDARKAVERVPIDIREQIVKMKKVSKKSYKYLAERFNLPIEVVQDVCAQHLKRPRQRRSS